MSIAPALPPPTSLPPPTGAAPPGAPPGATPFHSALEEELARTAPAEGQQTEGRKKAGEADAEAKRAPAHAHGHTGDGQATPTAPTLPGAAPSTPAELAAAPAGEESPATPVAPEAAIAAPGPTLAAPEAAPDPKAPPFILDAAETTPTGAPSAEEPVDPSPVTVEPAAVGQATPVTGSTAGSPAQKPLPSSDGPTTRPSTAPTAAPQPSPETAPATGEQSTAADASEAPLPDEANLPDQASGAASGEANVLNQAGATAPGAALLPSQAGAPAPGQANPPREAGGPTPRTTARSPRELTTDRADARTETAGSPRPGTAREAIARAASMPEPEVRTSAAHTPVAATTTPTSAARAAPSEPLTAPAQPAVAQAVDSPSSGAPLLASGVGMQEMIESIHATIALAARQGVSQARIALQPAELGEIRIHLTQTGDGLLARVTAETPAAAEALAGARSELHQSLSTLGTSLLRLDINSFAQPEGREGHGAGDASGQSSSRSGATTGPDGSIDQLNATDAPAPATGPALGELVDVLA
jgi:flagellar hook-length control protein FliK